MSASAPLVFYISGHGFGHASRDVEVINALRTREPSLSIIVCTQVPAWLMEASLTHPVELRQVECDTGLQQLDSLQIDEAASVLRAAEFYKDVETRAAREVEFLRERRVRLVLSDIPPLAFEAAGAAGLRSIGIGNFTWDWIYEGFPEHIATYPQLVPIVRGAYRRASLVLRLPMHGGFAGLERMTRDIPLIARRSRRSPAEIRRAIGLPDGPLLLLSFGAYGIRDIDRGVPGRLAGYTVVVTDDASGRELWREGVTRIDGAQLRQAGCRYVDLVRAVDIVVTKPGYGIVSECIANETAMLYTSRGRFPEYEVLVAEMQRYTRCEFIDQEALLAGRWEPYIERLLAASLPAARPRLDGANVAAGMILEMLG
jgi:L-arabinokinase